MFLRFFGIKYKDFVIKEDIVRNRIRLVIWLYEDFFNINLSGMVIVLYD